MAKIGINISTGTLQQKEMIVGIDLGTTNSLVAVIHPGSGQPVVLKEYDGHALVPSVIHFDGTGKVSVGDQAKNYLVSEPHNTIFSIKRLMGKSYNDVSDQASFFTYKIIDDNTDSLVKIQAGNTFYSPVELSALILKELKSRAEHILKTPVNRAVITVPAYFNDSQRQATRDAGKLAGLDVLRIVNEPTAASLAYGLGLQKEEIKTVAVYDLGGGTFDISILRISGGVYEVLSTHGNTYLGGDDFDQAIVEHWMEQVNLSPGKLAADKNLSQQLRILAEQAKIQLGTSASFTGKADHFTLHLSRDEFEILAEPLVSKTIDSCHQAVQDAGIAITDIDEVVMVGGSTRVPLVKKRTSDFFQKQLNDSLNPDEVVALGAAVQADILAGNNKELLLLDITPLSLGIETMGGLMDVLIPRNSKSPSRASRQYTTQKDGQGSIRIAVFQGERDLVRDNRKLAAFNLTGIPGMPAGLPKVEISFLVNADGILIVKAKELRSGVEQSIEVKPQYGLTDAEVEKMLSDSITHAKGDMQSRALQEALAEAELMVGNTEKFLKNNTRSLTEKEITSTQKAVADLRAIMDKQDKNAIQAAVEQLNEISRPYAERLMNEAIRGSIKGKSIDNAI